MAQDFDGGFRVWVQSLSWSRIAALYFNYKGLAGGGPSWAEFLYVRYKRACRKRGLEPGPFEEIKGLP